MYVTDGNDEVWRGAKRLSNGWKINQKIATLSFLSF